MSDVRGLSRGHKTAAVVILVVLLQVIVVAFLGLSAIAGDREEGVRLAREAARSQAQDQATRTLTLARTGVLAALEAAASVAKNRGGLRNQAPSDWYRTFLDVFRVDAEGRVRSADGTLLHVPPDVIATDEARMDRGELARLQKILAGPGRADPMVAEARRRLVREFPFATEDGYGTAVAEALQLALDVAAAPGATAAALEEAATLAYETAAVNDRPAAARMPFAYVRADLAKLAAAPGREALAATLAALDRARGGLARIRDYALPIARDAAAHPAPARVFPLPEPGPEVVVVGLAPLPSVRGDARPECLLVRLDRRALAALLEGPSGPAAGGPAVRVVPRETPVERDDGAVRLALRRGDFDPALDVVVPVPAVRGPEGGTGPRETFYWTILGLAAFGVTSAGVVLVRILRREVTLARLKTDFVSNLSHELKTPLTSISMFTEMLRDGHLSDDEKREAYDVVGQESERLQRIVGRMIDVARREAGADSYTLVAGDLNGPVRSACERFRRLEKSPGLRLEVGLAADLPPVALDADAVDDAVTNLLSNAWKYRRGDAAHVRVTTRRAGRRGVELVVADDGIGIARRERGRVFDMFYRADSFLTRDVPGTGLGLALVRTIVRAHRGRIRVEGAPGVGTTFRLRFPAAKGRPSAPPPAPAGPREASSRTAGPVAARGAN